MDDSSDKCLWLMEILIFCFLSLSLAFASLTTYLSLKSDYLPRQYEKNWEMNYLIDVIPTMSNYCPEGYETKVIGKWSGFNGGCYCSNNQTGIQIATDEKCNEILNDIFTCYPLIRTQPIDLIKYKGFQFCVKRSNDNYMSLFQKVNDIYNEGDHLSDNEHFDEAKDKNQNNNNNNDKHLNYRGKDDDLNDELDNNKFVNRNNHENHGYYEKYSDYIKILLDSAPPDYLDENAIIDLKIINTQIYNTSEISEYHYDLSNYEEKKINNTNYSLFTLRLRALDRPQNIFDLQKVLVDIHLYNELWCAYLDLSSTYLKSKFSKEDINYGGIEHCERFYFKKNSTLSFNDNFINTIRLNFEFDNTASLFDFYDYNGITEFYRSLKTQDPSNNPNLIKNSMYGNFEPIMTAQKYFMGIGCLYSKEPREHIKVLNANFLLTRLSGSIAGLLTICVFIALAYACAKARDCANFRLNAMFLLFIIMLICVLVSFTIDLLARQTLIYMQDYMIYCQTDYSNSQDNNALKVTAMENNFFELLLYIYRVSGSTSTSLFLGCLMLFIFLCRECRKKQQHDPSTLASRNVGINQFDISGLQNNNFKNYNSARNVGNINNNNQPMEIEIKVVGGVDKYNSNTSSNYKNKKDMVQEKPVENNSNVVPNNNNASSNYLMNSNNNSNNNKNTPQSNFGYPNNSNNFNNDFNNNNNFNNNFDHRGFEFSEGDASRKGPAAFSNRDAPAGGNEISGITDRSSINLNSFNQK